jgi:hypothetical protein
MGVLIFDVKAALPPVTDKRVLIKLIFGHGMTTYFKCPLKCSENQFRRK